MWHKYVQIAVMNYNTSYHESLGSISRTHPVQHSGYQTGTQARMEKRRQRKSNGRITKANNRKSPVSQGQPHAIIFEV